MASRSHRWPGDNHPLSAFHGGTAKVAQLVVKEAARRATMPRKKRAAKQEMPDPAREKARAEQAERLALLLDKLPPVVWPNQPPVTVTATFVRKDKVRPSVRAASVSRWNCRPIGKRHVHGGGIERSPAGWLEREEALLRCVVLADAQGWLCALCGQEIDILGRMGARISTDHVVPRYLGGWDEWGNFLAAHRQCNADKSNDEPTGCELVWLFAVNARLGLEPTRW